MTKLTGSRAQENINKAMETKWSLETWTLVISLALKSLWEDDEDVRGV